MIRGDVRSDRRMLRHGGRRSALSALALLGTAILLTLPTMAVGAAPAGLVLRPPYKTGVLNLTASPTRTGCSKLTVTVPVVFFASNATEQFRDRGGASGCPGARNNDASILDTLTLRIPLRLPIGRDQIVVHWHVEARGTAAVTLGSCAGGSAVAFWTCRQEADSYLNAFGYVEDRNNTTFAYPARAWPGINLVVENLTGCAGPFYGCGNYTSGPNGSFAVNTSFVWTITDTVVAHHVYFLYAMLSGGVTAEIVGSNSHIVGGKARATFDAGAAPLGITLASIVVR